MNKTGDKFENLESFAVRLVDEDDNEALTLNTHGKTKYNLKVIKFETEMLLFIIIYYKRNADVNGKP